jgi:nucleoid DNA-binding protein
MKHKQKQNVHIETIGEFVIFIRGSKHGKNMRKPKRRDIISTII